MPDPNTLPEPPTLATLGACVDLTCPGLLRSPLLIRSVGLSADGGIDGFETVYRPLVARVGGFNVPDVRFQWVPSAAYTHLDEIADGVFGLRES